MFESLLLDLDKAFREHKIPYMVIGGQAVLRYGEPRMTKDIDITLGVDADSLTLVLNSLRGLPLTPLADADFVQRTMVLPLREEQTGIRVDLVFSFSSYEAEAIARAVELPVGTATVRFASVEDLIVHKVVAGRPRDLEDVKSILARHRQADLAYVEAKLRQFSDALDIDLVARLQTLR